MQAQAQFAPPSPGGSAATAAAAGIGTGANPNYGIAVGDWLLYPSLFTGLVFNDNIYNTATNRRSGVGLRFKPSLQAERDTDIHRSTVYSRADFQVYPGRRQSYLTSPSYQVLRDPTTITANVGFSHDYKPLPDLKFTLIGDFTRGSGGIFGNGFGINAPPIPSASSITGPGTFSNQFTALAAVEKKFESAFLRLSGGTQYVIYDNQPTNWWINALSGVPAWQGAPSAPNAASFNVALRGGYWITPQVYAFAEPMFLARRNSNSLNDTNGYRIVGGLGTDLISLFRGEVFAGYQAQSSASGRYGTVSSPAFGGRLYYYPTRFLTIMAAVEQGFTAPTVQGYGPNGLALIYAPQAPSRTLSAKLQADYAVTEYWTSYARIGWGESRNGAYLNYGTVIPSWTYGTTTTVWGAGLGTSYTFYRNLALTLEYSFSKSVMPGATTLVNWWVPRNVTQNMVSAGLTYKY